MSTTKKLLNGSNTEERLTITLSNNEELLGDFDYYDWKSISRYQNLSEEFITKFKHLVDINYISVYQVLSEDFIKENLDILNMSNISKHQVLSEDFINKNLDILNISRISKFQALSEDFIKEHSEILYWELLMSNDKINATLEDKELFFNNNVSKIDKHAIFYTTKFSMDFLNHFVETTNDDDIDWDDISMNQILTEEFMDKYQNKLVWIELIQYQKMSTEFVDKHASLIDFDFLQENDLHIMIK